MPQTPQSAETAVEQVAREQQQLNTATMALAQALQRYVSNTTISSSGQSIFTGQTAASFVTDVYQHLSRCTEDILRRVDRQSGHIRGQSQQQQQMPQWALRQLASELGVSGQSNKSRSRSRNRNRQPTFN